MTSIFLSRTISKAILRSLPWSLLNVRGQPLQQIPPRLVDVGLVFRRTIFSLSVHEPVSLPGKRFNLIFHSAVFFQLLGQQRDLLKRNHSIIFSKNEQCGVLQAMHILGVSDDAIDGHPCPEFWVFHHQVMDSNSTPAESHDANFLCMTLLFQVLQDSIDLFIDLSGISCFQPLRKGGPVPRGVPWLLPDKEVWNNGCVPISCNHVSHISGIGQLPAEYILNDDHGFASIHGGSGDISLDVLDLHFTPHPSILYLMANVTRTRVSFVSHCRYSSWPRPPPGGCGLRPSRAQGRPRRASVRGDPSGRRVLPGRKWTR